MNIRLETEHLILRDVDIYDAALILELFNTPDFIRFIGDRNITDLYTAEQYIKEKLIHSYQINGYGLYMMIIKEEHIAIGLCGLVKRDAINPPDVGFSILPAYYRKGYTLEAARAVLKYSFEQLNLPEVLGLVHPDNQASIALLQKIGIPNDRIRITTD